MEDDDCALGAVFALVLQVTILIDELVQDVSAGVQVLGTIYVASLKLIGVAAVNDDGSFDHVLVLIVQDHGEGVTGDGLEIGVFASDGGETESLQQQLIVK